MKRLVFLFFFAILFLIPREAHADSKGQVFIINQVRGEECCDKGNPKNLKRQVDQAILYKIPSHFVLRYDALNDEKYTGYLLEKQKKHPDLIDVGLLLEITPKLAEDSGVKYNTSQLDNMEAQNIYSIGYSDQDNIKIGDLLFNRFREVFGNYPQITSSWMIKTNFLNYISDTYGVSVNQITREQYSVDGYTLYGGPPHYPYPASSNWAFIPDYERNDAPLIVRQTLTDPLYNYGDNTGTYTSQPNDYLQNKDFSYFKKLLDQAMFNQSQTGFALIGLENSMEEKFQNEYFKQLKLLGEYKEAGKISFPTTQDLSNYWSDQKLTIYKGADLVKSSSNQVIWITTPKYRIRLREEKQEIFIDDIRIYDSGFKDPYSIAPAKKKGYWIAPFLLTGFQINHNERKALFKRPDAVDKFLTLTHDIDSETNRLNLPLLGKNSKLSMKNTSINYLSNENNRISLSFEINKILTKGIRQDEFAVTGPNLSNYPITLSSNNKALGLSWTLKNKTWLNLNISCKNKACSTNIVSNPDAFPTALKDHYPYLFPQQTDHQIDIEKSVIYENNKYAIAGRNPVRIVVIPYDKYGIVTNIHHEDIGYKRDLKGRGILSKDGQRYFLDFYSDTSGKDNAMLLLWDVGKKIDFYFAPNCKAQIRKCVANPKYSWWYIRAILGDKSRRIFYNEAQ